MTPTQSVRTMPTRPPKTCHYRADIREICRAKLQAGSRRPAERIRPKGEREVAAGMVLRMLMQRERHSVQDFPPGYNHRSPGCRLAFHKNGLGASGRQQHQPSG